MYTLSTDTSPGIRDIWIACHTTPTNRNSDGIITSFDNQLFEWFKFEANECSLNTGYSYDNGGTRYDTSLDYSINGLSQEKITLFNALTYGKFSLIAVGDKPYYLGSRGFYSTMRIEDGLRLNFSSIHSDPISEITSDLLAELGKPLEPVNLCINGVNICIQGENIQILD